ncbi:MAG: hypothetical protein ACO3NL_04175, partial [Phycisphaerales bacterium]
MCIWISNSQMTSQEDSRRPPPEIDRPVTRFNLSRWNAWSIPTLEIDAGSSTSGSDSPTGIAAIGPNTHRGGRIAP